MLIAFSDGFLPQYDQSKLEEQFREIVAESDRLRLQIRGALEAYRETPLLKLERINRHRRLRRLQNTQRQIAEELQVRTTQLLAIYQKLEQDAYQPDPEQRLQSVIEKLTAEGQRPSRVISLYGSDGELSHQSVDPEVLEQIAESTPPSEGQDQEKEIRVPVAAYNPPVNENMFVC